MKELTPQFEENKHFESLRNEVFELKLEEESLDEKTTHHFPEIDPQELTYSDLQMYEVISRYPKKGTITLEQFEEARKPVVARGTLSQREFWAYLSNIILPIVVEPQISALKEKKAQALEEKGEGK